METFLYSEFTSAALSKVWAGQAKLPSSDFMWARHWERVGKGYGRTFMAYGVEKQAAITKYLVGWLYQDAAKSGGYQWQVNIFLQLHVGLQGEFEALSRLPLSGTKYSDSVSLGSVRSSPVFAPISLPSVIKVVESTAAYAVRTVVLVDDGNSERRALLGNDMVTDQPGSRPQMNEGETSGEMQ
ncbi:hypothetical protein F5876DRAFT_70059 [Lentinula aff. lateritia]|uniref:Uncharacterized protein n=1 Tax=Lentinula aff. lateritia TaxID=2804960 RepID=A0ACC1TK66_9AGAR|nr:hypothetical protein F5876DRAFT_70059 [Lentinula aff. lateritia]